MLTLTDILGLIADREFRASSSGGLGRRIAGACVDSRQARKGFLFIALPGERTDGHLFLADAFGKGASLLLISRTYYAGHSQELPDADLIIVDDTLSALQELAGGWRRRHSVKVVGITGSVGKTSTKDMVAAVLSRRFTVLKNEANFNSEIGLPLTLLNLDESHQRAVLEMAMYAEGDISLLCRIAGPEIGVVTNVGPSHMERLGSLENICRAKAELVDSLPAAGVAILNADDELVRSMAGRTGARVILFGLDRRSDVRAVAICSPGLDRVEFELHLGGQKAHVTLPVPGEHNVLNALGAASVGMAEGLSLGEIVDGLEGMRFESRVRLLPGINGSVVIDDSYNASPVSTVAALNLLSRAVGRKIAVLGDMYELGPFELEAHRQVGRRAAQVADKLIVVGEKGKIIGAEALRCGLAAVAFCSCLAEAADLLTTFLSPSDHVLVKGSRGMHMEDIVERIKSSC
ncbi:MAG: UDP-N-acetylmuramoyl-tripeptide--D-alanyl-D-alanine ligase [Dehalococcoidia bacterium]|nr:UDP-N-acetylmuramoyl-tripeptide--D-alanyl-D-alanine ligase [Dehalococcoidia bacterium]